MRTPFLFFIAICFCFDLKAQYEEPIINENYPYKIVYPKSLPGFAPGLYLFTTDLDYFNYQSAGLFNPILLPAFFSYGEMGLIINKSLPTACDVLIVESVIETHSKIIINTKIIRPKTINWNIPRGPICLKLKRSTKEVVISEIIEELGPLNTDCLIRVISIN